jgi:uncharacterized protein (DUF2252 family)
MVVSPYALLRGNAAIMAEDFAGLPKTGIMPVICGDAHLSTSLLHRSATWFRPQSFDEDRRCTPTCGRTVL